MKYIRIIIMLLIAFLILVSCTEKKDKPVSQRKPVDLKYDNIQKIIMENYKPSAAVNQVFCVYEVVWIKEETYYSRKFVYAFMEEIAEDLTVGESVSFPIAMIYDKQKSEYIRHFLINDPELDNSEAYSTFPPEAFSFFNNIDALEMSEKNNRMHNELLAQAHKFYQIDEDDSEEIN